MMNNSQSRNTISEITKFIFLTKLTTCFAIRRLNSAVLKISSHIHGLIKLTIAVVFYVMKHRHVFMIKTFITPLTFVFIKAQEYLFKIRILLNLVNKYCPRPVMISFNLFSNIAFELTANNVSFHEQSHNENQYKIQRFLTKTKFSKIFTKRKARRFLTQNKTQYQIRYSVSYKSAFVSREFRCAAEPVFKPFFNY